MDKFDVGMLSVILGGILLFYFSLTYLKDIEQTERLLELEQLRVIVAEECKVGE